MPKNWSHNIYLDYLEETYPRYYSSLTTDSQEKLIKLYLLINEIYKTSEIFENRPYISTNYINLIREYKTYLSRVLLLVPINDKYLVDSIIRLITEKSYRIIYGINHPHLLETSIRKHPRRKMSDRLDSFPIVHKLQLDSMYAMFSELIHHTDSTDSDLLNFKQLAKYEGDLVSYIYVNISNLRLVYMHDIFCSILRGTDLDLPSKYMLNNDTSEEFQIILKGNGII